MDIVSAIIVFLLTWWMVFFMALPWGVQRDDVGTGAPREPMLKKKFIITTLISLVVSGIILVLIEMEMFSWLDFANRMMEEDYK